MNYSLQTVQTDQINIAKFFIAHLLPLNHFGKLVKLDVDSLQIVKNENNADHFQGIYNVISLSEIEVLWNDTYLTGIGKTIKKNYL